MSRRNMGSFIAVLVIRIGFRVLEHLSCASVLAWGFRQPEGLWLATFSVTCRTREEA